MSIEAAATIYDAYRTYKAFKKSPAEGLESLHATIIGGMAPGPGHAYRDLGKALDAAQTARGVRNAHLAGRVAPALPAFTQGGKTAGVLRTASADVALQSGWAGPASSIPRGTSGFDIVTRTHVDGHAVAAMRQSGISEATLYINNPAICASCANLLPRMLPPGAQLTVITPSGSRTFVGIAR